MLDRIYAISENFANEYFEMRAMVSPEDKKQAFSLFGELKKEKLPIYKIQGETAFMKIKGPLSKNGPDFIDLFLGYGGTAYSSIIEAAEEIGKDENVKKVILEMDTPGGEVAGVFEASEAIDLLSKKKKVIAMNLKSIASGGYWLASQAHKIYANNPLAETGSIGVVWVLRDRERNVKDDEYGYARVRIVSQNAKNKRPDITKPKERQWMQNIIDGIEDLFISSIASGRKISKQTIIDNFGNGAMFLANDDRSDADDAVKIDMIDGIVNYKESNFEETSLSDEGFKGLFDYEERKSSVDNDIDNNNELNPATNNAGENNKEVLTMTLQEFLAQNPAAKTEYDNAIAEAKQAGKKEVQDIVAKAAPFIGNAEYPKQISEAAVAVIKGEKPVEVLDTMAVAADMIKEMKSSAAAGGETPPDTNGNQGDMTNQLSEEYIKNGIIMNQADMIADEKRRGMEVK